MESTPGKIRFYQAATLLLLAVVLVQGLMFQRYRAAHEEQPAPAAPAPEPEPAVRVLNLAQRVAAIQAQHPGASDRSETYFRSAEATVHMHVIGFQQTCPLHIHRVTEEATVIVSGAPQVRQLHGAEGQLVQLQRSPSVGTLLYAPPFCGHEWINGSADQMQGNLVFASPPFDGNFYLARDDPRQLKGGQPWQQDPDSSLASFLSSSSAPYALEVLPIMQGQISSLLVRGRISLPPSAQASIVYVQRGAGSLQADETYPVQASSLALIEPRRMAELVAQPGSPLAALLFRSKGPAAATSDGGAASAP